MNVKQKRERISGFPSHSQRRQMRSRLLSWYDLHHRELPWRESRDPYRVWISEIMLQQTRVAAVIAHYHEFLRRFPVLEKLAAAREASVLAAWSGLGYYRRARMMHAAAKAIVREHDGKFPSSAAELLKLPGIGRYTAAAVASIAFDQPVAVVDGNVERVLERISGRRLPGEPLWKLAGELLDQSRPGDFNQAMMELGATICTPRAPSCLTCPVVSLCASRGELAAAAKLARQKKSEIHFALNCHGGNVLLVQRPPDASLMAGMWELPEVRKTRDRNPDFTLRHSITVTNYTVRVWRSAAPASAGGEWKPVARLKQVALTGLARKILLAAEII